MAILGAGAGTGYPTTLDTIQSYTKAIALKIEVPWTQTNRQHLVALKLHDADGQLVTIPTPDGEHPVQFGGGFEVGRPAGLPEGTPLDVALAVVIAPLALTPASRYEWRCFIDGETQDDWRLGFSTRPRP